MMSVQRSNRLFEDRIVPTHRDVVVSVKRLAGSVKGLGLADLSGLD